LGKEKRKEKIKKGEENIEKERWGKWMRKRDGIRNRKDKDRIRQNEIGM